MTYTMATVAIYLIGEAIVRQFLTDSKQRELEALKKSEEAATEMDRRVMDAMKKAGMMMRIRQRLGIGTRMRRLEEATRLVVVESEGQCCICLEECEVGTMLRQLPCTHLYHNACLQPWFKKSDICPYCTQRV